MEQQDTVIEQFQAIQRDIKPRHIDTLEVRQTRADIGNIVDMMLALSPLDTNDSRQVILSFHGVAGLRFTPGNNALDLSLLEIYSIKDRQWENIKYKVAETEDELLSFFCADFSVTVMNES